MSDFIIVSENARGMQGADGRSAYELALKNGFVGTEAEWLKSLIGLSAYEIAVKLGFKGTEAQWIASLKGDTGDVTPEAKAAKEAAETAAKKSEQIASELYKTVDERISSAETNIMKQVNTGDFFPRKPFIGYSNDDTVANIFGVFNISNPTISNIFVISDNRSEECLYYYANSGRPGEAISLKIAKRQQGTGFNFYINREIRPPFLSSTEYISYTYGLGNDWAIFRITNTSPSSTRTCLIKTNGSSDENDWEFYKDLAPILVSPSTLSAMCSSIYFSEFDNLFMAWREDGAIYYKIVKISSMTEVVSRKLLVDVINMLDYSIFQGSLTRTHGGLGYASIVFNPYDSVLSIYTRFLFNGTIAGVPASQYYSVYIPLQISTGINFFNNGVGTLSNLLPASEYILPASSTANPTLAIGGESIAAQIFNFTMDRYNQSIYHIEQTAIIRRLGQDNRPTSRIFRSANATNSTTFSTPDSAPWSKSFTYGLQSFMGYLYNKNIYFQGDSSRYGNTNRLSTQYNLNEVEAIGATDYIKLVPATWWMSRREEDDNVVNAIATSVHLSVIRDELNNVRFIHYNGSTITELLHENSFVATDESNKSGRRYAVTLPNPIHSLPTQYIYHKYLYDPIRNRAFFIVADIVSTDPSKQGFIFLLYWSASTGFVEYRNLEALDFFSETTLNQRPGLTVSFNDNNSKVASFFVDNDGLIYFAWSWTTSTGGYSGGQTLTIDMLQPIIMSRASNSILPVVSFGRNRIGWDSLRGYYVCGGSTIRCSKGILPTQQMEFTKGQFLAGSWYSYNAHVGTPSGLIAYLFSTPIFIGGYFTELEPTDIALYPNSDNYIYFERDSLDRKKVNIIISTSLIGGERGFSRVLVSKITTDSHNVIAQEDYPVEWDY